MKKKLWNWLTRVDVPYGSSWLQAIVFAIVMSPVIYLCTYTWWRCGGSSCP